MSKALWRLPIFIAVWLVYLIFVKLPTNAVGFLVIPFLYTVGIICGMDETGYKHRFCYPNEDAAMLALLAWIGSDDDEPIGYITKK